MLLDNLPNENCQFEMFLETKKQYCDSFFDFLFCKPQITNLPSTIYLTRCNKIAVECYPFKLKEYPSDVVN